MVTGGSARGVGRDHIHVADLADAHLTVASRLAGQDGAGDLTVNVGRGEGASVLAPARVVAEVTGHGTPAVVEPRRPGDAARAVASVERIGEELGWTASRGVRETVESAWAGRLLHHSGAAPRRAAPVAAQCSDQLA